MRLARRYRPIGPARPLELRAAVVAQDRVAGGTCVLKFARAGSAAAEDLAAEADRLARLGHPHLLRLVDHFVDCPDPWDGPRVSGFATRWVDGLPLTRALAQAPLSDRLSAFGELLDATAYLHRRGLLHLDLKPENVLYGDEGVVLLDLGSARPLDAGPGEAGGTLGYAAPEVLAGEAASVAADLFSLGAILYALLTGARPFEGVDALELRRAALAGEFVPVRALAPETDPVLARLAEALLARDPAARPDGVDAVLAWLDEAGSPCLLHPGDPPLVGRDELLERLMAATASPGGHRISLVGPPGSGRSRLARAALWRGAAAGSDRRLPFDLSQTEDPLRTLDGLACLAGTDVPARGCGAPWIRAVAAGLEAWTEGPATVFLGRREDQPPDSQRTLDALVPALVAGGFCVVEAVEDERAGALPIRLSPLAPTATSALGNFYGWVGAARVRELHERTGGLPGALVRLLAPRARSGVGRLGPATRALALLACLPPGIPTSVLAVLPLRREHLGMLEERRLLRQAADRRHYVEIEDPPPPDPELLAEAAQALRGVDSAIDPAWLALALVRVGDLDGGGRRLDQLDLDGSARRSILVELAERLADAGHRRAQRLLAGLREEDGDLAGAARLLAALADRDVDEERQLVRVLRRGGQLPEAERIARVGLARHESPALWLELAQIHLSRGELEAAEAACASAEALAPQTAEDEALALRVGIAIRRMNRGERPAGLAELLERVERLAGAGRLDSATLSSAGRILTGTGELDRGERMLARAAHRADEEGDARRSAGIRLNRGNALQSLGRGRDARVAYRDALAIAESTGDTSLLLRIRYSLADLELRSGRVPAAETQVRAFQAEAREVGDEEVHARVAELQGRLLLARKLPGEALACLRSMKTEGLSINLRISRDLGIAQALLDLQRADEVLPGLAETPRSRVPSVNAYGDALRGRAHLALARRYLQAARAAVPEEPDPLVRLETGTVLLAAAGEDLDPESFGARRRDLDHAARLLRGAAAADAASLRDRLLDGPGANLEGIVQLTEAMHDPRAFPGALARLVGQALGAYRVLIMVAIPGLGRQVTYTELSGAEAAGIGREVLRRIQKPDDHWLAHNAFADPHLRQTSQTVRTFELKSLLAVAIPQGDKAVGALYVDDLHRTNRFSDADVAILKRLAAGVGRMLPMLSLGRRGQVFAEPQELLGVLLSNPAQIADLDESLSMLRGRSQTNLLISGPTGAGKSVMARRVARDVLGLEDVEAVVLRVGDPQFLITQLTGAKKGEYTGATDREGAIQRCLRLKRALFLDEVQNLDEAGQQILLPLLELPERYFGGLTASSAPLGQELHIILGTNAEVGRGRWVERFREDLWYRMSAVHLVLPPLRDRGPQAIYLYLAAMLAAQETGRPEEVFDVAALHRVTGWEWPGNLRQLQRFAERAAHLHRSTGQALRSEQLARLGLEDEALESAIDIDAEGIDQAVVDTVWQALRRNAFVQSKAATDLRMNPSRLNKFLKRHSLLDEVARQRRELRRDED